MKRYFYFVLLVTLLLTVTLVWFSVIRLHEFKQYHLSIASNTTTAVANEIARFVVEKKRLMDVFTSEHQQLIHRVISNPHKQASEKQMALKLSEYFPAFFTFTLTDARGRPYLTDFDGLLGKQCLQDIKGFARNHTQLPNIHPHPERYHFDIMSEISDGAVHGILFVSFDAELLGQILANTEVPGHQVLLVNANKNMLLEVSATGARNKDFRADYHLTTEERDRVLHGTDIPGTSWRAIDLYSPRLFSSYRNQIVQQSMIICFGYLALLATLFTRIRYMENLRHQAEQHKNEFLSIVSHELRTPLTSIHGALSLVQNGKVGQVEGKTRDFITIALNNSERLSYLVDDLLDVQRIESGQMDFQMSPTDLGTLVRACIDSQQEFARKYHSSISLENDIGQVQVYVDKQRISQAIINLLSNAVKYGAEGDQILVKLTEVHDQARIMITNHGQPIEEKHRSRIFEKFIQLDASATRSVGGTGLGLNIVKQIVEKHQGIVDFYSSQESTTFFIDLPIY